MSRVAGASAAAVPRELQRVPKQIDLGLLQLETKDREKIVLQIDLWAKAERAPFTATALAIARAAYQGVQYVGVRGTKSHKTLQRDAGLAARLDDLREPDPAKRKEMRSHETRRSIRVYFLGWKELRDAGVVVAERIPPRDPRFDHEDLRCGHRELPLRPGQRWAVPPKGLCVCPWHHGATVWTLGALSLPEFVELGRAAVAERGRMRLLRPLTRKPAWEQTPQGPTPSRRRKASRNAANTAAPGASLDVISDRAPEVISEASGEASQITSRSATVAAPESPSPSAVFSAEAPIAPPESQITSISGSTTSPKKSAKSSPPSPGTRAPASALPREDVSPSATRVLWPPSPPAPEPERALWNAAATGGPASAGSSGLLAALVVLRAYLRAARVTERDPLPGELLPIERAFAEGFTVAHCVRAIAEGFASKHNARDPSRLTLSALLAPTTLRALIQRAEVRGSAPLREADRASQDRANLPGGARESGDLPACKSCRAPLQSSAGPLCSECYRRDREARAREKALERQAPIVAPPAVRERLAALWAPPAADESAIAEAEAAMRKALSETDYEAFNAARARLEKLRAGKGDE